MNSRVFLCTLCTLLIGNSLSEAVEVQSIAKPTAAYKNGRLKKYAGQYKLEPTRYSEQNAKDQKKDESTYRVNRQKSPRGRVMDVVE